MEIIKKLLITTVLIAPVTVSAAILEADTLISGDNIHFIDGPFSVNDVFSVDSPSSSTDPVSISRSASIRG